MVGLSELASSKVTALELDVQAYVWPAAPSSSVTIGFGETDDPRATDSGPPASTVGSTLTLGSNILSVVVSNSV